MPKSLYRSQKVSAVLNIVLSRAKLVFVDELFRGPPLRRVGGAGCDHSRSSSSKSGSLLNHKIVVARGYGEGEVEVEGDTDRVDGVAPLPLPPPDALPLAREALLCKDFCYIYS